jgi:hypothetical protein
VENSSPDDSLLGKFFASYQNRFVYLKNSKVDFSIVLSRFAVLNGTKIWNIMVGDKQGDFGSSLAKNFRSEKSSGEEFSAFRDFFFEQRTLRRRILLAKNFLSAEIS